MDANERDEPSAWPARAAEALGEPAMTPREVAEVLRLARRVAHGVERKMAPLAAFLLGAAVGSRTATGRSREEAFREALAAVEQALAPPEKQE